MATKNKILINRLASRVQEDAFFMGSSLYEFKKYRNLDDTGLAHFLKCDSSVLSKLALCRNPSEKNRDFSQDVEYIAQFISCDADRLLQLLREVNAIQALQETNSIKNPEALLMAARDHEKHYIKNDDRKKTSTPRNGKIDDNHEG